jgi:hypothetical protein
MKINIKNRFQIKHYVICGISLLLILLIIFGSIWDFQIDQNVYQYKSFGFYFSPLATIVFLLILIFACGFMISKPLIMMKRIGKVKSWLISIVLFILITSVLAYELNHYRGDALEDWIPILHGRSEIIRILIFSPIGIVLSCGATIGAFVLQKNNKTKHIFTFKWALWAIVSCLIAHVIVSGMKAGLPRERFSCYIEGKEFQFRNWYELLWNPSIKFEGLSDDDIQSFPSGHVNYACVVLASIPIILTGIKNKRAQAITLTSVGVFLALIMFARLNDGDHYLTDVTWSVIINLVIYGSLYQAFKLIKISK